ncbi:acyl-CoA dehydrogenase family protein [Sphingomonas sp. BAUL-RG-20F-R05-02]|uniref:acyl-CoA dehydrogenase family protein n=1 Tax=Sphingomonas sp. BAUL-RG-20F-R05-02 TaxID=2914830 RepID=UPI001F56F4B3|nr:acyl-CoA dehydrogenase family protein [Sphingomonas sp. BAUL-RG-20F-R05-02]
MFEETIERLLGDMVTVELLVAAEAGVWPEALWQAIEENGLTLAAATEDRGGVGGSWHDAFVLVRAAGRHAAPVPLAETIAVNWLLARAGLDAITGPATLGTVDADGVLHDVPWPRHARHVLTVVEGELLLFATDGLVVGESLNIAREPRGTIRIAGAEPLCRAPLRDLPKEIVLLTGAMIRSAQIAGALQRLLDTAIDYANQRVQFGRPIGKFQAIQHQIALLAEHAMLASATAEAAFAANTLRPEVFAIAAAKSVASEAAGAGAGIAHAVLGAIGFTYEHALHFGTRRLWSWRSEFGGQTYWAGRIGTAVAQAGGQGFLPQLVDGSIAA